MKRKLPIVSVEFGGWCGLFSVWHQRRNRSTIFAVDPSLFFFYFLVETVTSRAIIYFTHRFMDAS